LRRAILTDDDVGFAISRPPGKRCATGDGSGEQCSDPSSGNGGRPIPDSEGFGKIVVRSDLVAAFKKRYCPGLAYSAGAPPGDDRARGRRARGSDDLAEARAPCRARVEKGVRRTDDLRLVGCRRIAGRDVGGRRTRKLQGRVAPERAPELRSAHTGPRIRPGAAHRCAGHRTTRGGRGVGPRRARRRRLRCPGGACGRSPRGRSRGRSPR